jgi:hypothetical protein
MSKHKECRGIRAIYDEQLTAKCLPQLGGEAAYPSMPGWSL